ncbi:MAG: hypothetical protein WBG50_08105 [Desulfomonilaceae bacterium]
MKSIGETIFFNCAGLYGQWLGYGKGWPYLVIFWFLIIASIWLRNKQRWSKLVQTSIQSAWLIILVLFLLNVLTTGT